MKTRFGVPRSLRFFRKGRVLGGRLTLIRKWYLPRSCQKSFKTRISFQSH